MKPLDYWVDGLKSFFEQVETDLVAMLDANGCREGWLQGEAMLFFRRRSDVFYVNYEPLSRGTKADFAAYPSDDDGVKPWMVGEMKVLGIKGYQRKVLGMPIAPLLELLARGATSLPIRAFDTALGWGLASDYRRLRDYEPEQPLVRLLVLVLDTRGGKADGLGRVLQAIDFDPPAIVLRKTKDFVAKCWPVPGRS